MQWNATQHNTLQQDAALHCDIFIIISLLLPLEVAVGPPLAINRRQRGATTSHSLISSPPSHFSSHPSYLHHAMQYHIIGNHYPASQHALLTSPPTRGRGRPAPPRCPSCAARPGTWCSPADIVYDNIYLYVILYIYIYIILYIYIYNA